MTAEVLFSMATEAKGTVFIGYSRLPMLILGIGVTCNTLHLVLA